MHGYISYQYDEIGVNIYPIYKNIRYFNSDTQILSILSNIILEFPLVQLTPFV